MKIGGLLHQAHPLRAYIVAMTFAPVDGRHVESAIDYQPPSIIGRARALRLAAANKLIIVTDRLANVG